MLCYQGCKGVGRNILLFSFTQSRHTEPLKSVTTGRFISLGKTLKPFALRGLHKVRHISH